MKLSEMANKLDILLKKQLAEDWDNVGLLLGNTNSDVKKVLLTIEVDKHIVKEAVENKVDLIIAHHPIIFNGIKVLTNTSETGENIIELIKNNISVYVAHTNYDSLGNGLNSYVAQMLEIRDLRPLTESSLEGDYYLNDGMGRIGELNEEIDIVKYYEFVKETLNSPSARLISESKSKIKNIAIVTGSGGEFYKEAMEKGADLFITGDIKYHMAKEIIADGFSVIDAGHFDTEKFFPESMSDFLIKNFKEIEFINSKKQINPFFVN